MNETYDENIINEFIAESRDHLENMEPGLLSMEQEGANVSPEIINNIFRAMHSIKGASSFLGFNVLTQLSHAMENVLMKFREGELVPNPDNIEPLLAGFDKISIMIEDIHTSNEVPYDDELTRLNAILEGKTKKHEPKPEQALPRETGSSKTSSIEEFVAQCKEGLEEIIQNFILVKMDSIDQQVPKEVIEPVCMAMLEICNGSKALGFNSLNNLSSALSDIFTKFKNNELIPDSQMVSTLLDGISTVDSMVEKIHDSDSIPYKDELEMLKAILCTKETHKDPLKDIKTESFSDKALEAEPKKSPLNKGAPRTQNEKKPSTPETVRVGVELINSMMNLASELVLGRNQLRQEIENRYHKSSSLLGITHNIDIVTSELQEDIMKMRLQPVGNLLNKFTRIVRDLSRQLSKEVNLSIKGKDVELDKTILEGLSDPLTHLVRNCMDHGIEPPDDREKIDKPRSGNINIKAFHEGGQVNILIEDDGRGIDPEKLMDKAVSNGAISLERAKAMSDTEKVNLILLPGLSTAESVTDLSGRGVGMDVVKTNIEKLGGHIDIESIQGKGTSIRIRIPLTLAIIPCLIVGSEKHKFAIPQVNVKELILIRANNVALRIEKIRSAEVLHLREKLLPLLNLAAVLGIEKTYSALDSKEKKTDRRQSISGRRQNLKDSNLDIDDNNAPIYDRRSGIDRRQNWRNDINVAVLKIGMHNYGLIVDELFDNEEIVVKPLSKHIKDCKCFAGATIMGDGRVAMILDALGIAELSKLNFTDITKEEARRIERKKLSKTISEHCESILLFNNAFDEYFALPLDSISRLEMIDASAVSKIGNHSFIKYRDGGLPLIHLDSLIPVSPFPKEVDEFYLIIPKTTGQQVGIAVSRILDTVQTKVNIKHDKITHQGILGSSLVEGQLTIFLNTKELLGLISEQSFMC